MGLLKPTEGMTTMKERPTPVPCSVSDTPRTNAVLSKPDDHPHLPTMFVELTIHAKQLERELAQWKQNFIPFAIVHAGQYGKEHYGKEGCLHYTHYDLLKEAGARLVDFTRCGDSQNVQGDGRREPAPPSQPTSSPFHPPTCSPLPESPKD